MSTPTTSSYWNQTTPAVPSGDQACVVQTDGATPQDSRTIYPKTATTSLRGVVKPDGTTIDVASDGTISVDASVTANLATKAGVQQEAYVYAADTGTANAYAVTLSPAPTLVAGSEVVFKAANANTGASTLAVNGGTATAIRKNGNSTALAPGDITGGQIVTVKHDGTVWQMIAPGGTAITLKHDGVLNSSQTLQNLRGSSSVSITDLGSGDLQFSIATPTPGFVQHSQSGNSSLPAGAFTQSVTVPSVTRGDCLIVMATSDGTAGPNSLGVSSGSCTDNQGDTPQAIYISTGFWPQINLWIIPNCNGGNTTVTITGNATSAAGFIELSVTEWTNVLTASVVDVSNVVNNVHSYSGSTFDFGPITTTNANDLLIAGIWGGSAFTPTAPTGWGTALPATAATGGTVAYFADPVSATGTYHAVVNGIGTSALVGFALALKSQSAGYVSTFNGQGGAVTGVSSFNGRTGAVVPTTGDYTAAQVTGAATQSAVQQESYVYAADTGTANAYAVALSPAPTLVAGSEVVFKAANANTGASTLAVNGGSTIAIKKNGNSTALAPGDITGGQIVTVKYDGTVWQMIAPGSGGGSGVSDVNGATGSITLTGSGVSQSGSTFTFSGGSGGAAVVNITSLVTISGASLSGNQAVVVTPGTTVSFSSIPGTYSALQIMVVGRSSASATNDGVSLQFNTDTGSNYSRQYFGGANASAVAGQNASTTPPNAPPMLISAATSLANSPGTNTILIPGYAGTTFNKEAISNIFLVQGSPISGSMTSYQIGYHWASTAPITKVVMSPTSGGNFVAGSTFTIYGIP